MATTEDLTTLVCLFHYQDQASAAIEALFKQGVPPASISVIEQDGSEAASLLDELGVPVRDRKHLLDGLRHKGIIVAVSATTNTWQSLKRSSTSTKRPRSMKPPSSAKQYHRWPLLKTN